MQESGPNAERSAHEQRYTDPLWYACYTRARHEKQVEAQLRQRGFESYAPVIPRLRQWKDRKKVVLFPLFPSYVFVRFALREIYGVLTTPGVSTIVRTNGQPAPIGDSEIENVRRLEHAVSETGVRPEPRPFFAEGQWVRIIEGPFEGVEGIVVEQRGRKRVLVGVAAIGQGLEIDIDIRLLKPIR